MDRTTRLRRVGILCCHFIRNYAYYKSGSDASNPRSTHDFWVTLNGNFLDIAVLEWYKLFGDYNGKHHWRKIMKCDHCFKQKMLQHAGIEQSDLDAIHRDVKEYRDKFVAHLDSKEVMHIPTLEQGLQRVFFYFSEVKKRCSETSDWPENIENFYQLRYQEGLEQYATN